MMVLLGQTRTTDVLKAVGRPGTVVIIVYFRRQNDSLCALRCWPGETQNHFLGLIGYSGWTDNSVLNRLAVDHSRPHEQSLVSHGTSGCHKQ